MTGGIICKGNSYVCASVHAAGERGKTEGLNVVRARTSASGILLFLGESTNSRYSWRTGFSHVPTSVGGPPSFACFEPTSKTKKEPFKVEDKQHFTKQDRYPKKVGKAPEAPR